MASGLRWIREDAPRWDADKRRLFGPAELAATGLTPPPPGAPVADEWWHVADAAGTVVGYGWLDSEWGDAEVTFLVAPGHRGAGIGAFILDRLEAEAAARGLNYICNVVPASSPDPGWVTGWLTGHGNARGRRRPAPPGARGRHWSGDRRLTGRGAGADRYRSSGPGTSRRACGCAYTA